MTTTGSVLPARAKDEDTGLGYRDCVGLRPEKRLSRCLCVIVMNVILKHQVKEHWHLAMPYTLDPFAKRLDEA